MSYLVDALKKAERERHEQRGADLRSISASDTPYGSGSSQALRWFVIVLAVCNIGLLVYLFWPGRTVVDTAPQIAETPASTDATAPANAPASAIEPAARRATDARAQPPQRQLTAAQAPRTQPPPDRAETVEGLRLSSNLPNERGRVTFSRTPLDSSATVPSSLAMEDAPSAESLAGRVPDVAINGHLYSSVPGRSFILVDGRRYHEGERLAAGPAVESIDATGATLNYQGQRYHVNGPG
ncbi:general secretion pathway protein GspB [Salinisphaera sp. T31B1]|uniref:general secretion pathway protein GspB n=1 Tax=Salinisphaera sp. T31B1 TaxID=727963 RepID=UPI003340FCF3